jgi:hypothetical protein
MHITQRRHAVRRIKYIQRHTWVVLSKKIAKCIFIPLNHHQNTDKPNKLFGIQVIFFTLYPYKLGIVLQMTCTD